MQKDDEQTQGIQYIPPSTRVVQPPDVYYTSNTYHIPGALPHRLTTKSIRGTEIVGVPNYVDTGFKWFVFTFLSMAIVL